jgi:fibronectin-binding autotransporter adhesin
MNTRRSPFPLVTFLALFASAALGQETWDGGGANNNWSTGDNWADGTAPSGSVAGALTFSGTTRTTNANDISGLSFTSLVLNDSNWNISGNAFSLSSGITISTGTAPIVSNDLTLTGTGNRTLQTQNTGGGTLTFSGAFNASGLEIRKDGSGSSAVFNGAGKNVSFATLAIRKGDVTFNNGVLASATTFQIGNDASQAGIVNVSGTGTQVSVSGNIEIGRNSGTNDGRLNVSGGTVSAGILLTGQNAATSATSGVYQSGGIISATHLRAGNNGASTIEVSGGTMNILNGNGSSSTYGLTQAGASVMTISGGAVNIGTTDSQKWNLAAGAGGGTLNLNGGTLSVLGFSKVNTTGNTAIHLNGGTLRSLGNATNWLDDLTNTTVQVGNGGAVIDTNGFTFTITEGLIANGSGGLTKNNSGTLTLAGNSTYTGNTAVTAGSLVVTGNISTSLLTTVSNNASLSGSGTVGAVNIHHGGTLAPGTSPGTLTIAGALGLNETSILSFELNPLDMTPGGGINDLVTGISNLTLNGLLNVVATSGSFTGLTSGSWRLFDYSSTLSNNILSLNSMPALDSGYIWQIDTATSGQVNLNIAAVPEPAAALLGSIGILTLLRRRR